MCVYDKDSEDVSLLSSVLNVQFLMLRNQHRQLSDYVCLVYNHLFHVN